MFLYYIVFIRLGWHELGVQERHGEKEVGVLVHFWDIQALQGKTNAVDYVESSPAGSSFRRLISVLIAAEDA